MPLSLNHTVRAQSTLEPGEVTDGAYYITYRDWGNNNWCASIHDTKFMHAPNCNWQNAHLADYIAYKTHDGSTRALRSTARASCTPRGR